MTPQTEKLEQLKTRQMEKSYHVLFQQIANHCIENGIDIKMVTTRLDRYRVDVTQQFVKSTWKAILQSLTGKTSTTQQTKEDVKLVQAEFGKFWEELTGQQFDWPAIENQMLQNHDDPKWQ